MSNPFCILSIKREIDEIKFVPEKIYSVYINIPFIMDWVTSKDVYEYVFL